MLSKEGPLRESSRDASQEREKRGYMFSIPAEDDDGYQLVAPKARQEKQNLSFVIPDTSFASKAKDAVSGAPEEQWAHGNFSCIPCSGAPDIASLAFDENEDEHIDVVAPPVVLKKGSSEASDDSYETTGRPSSGASMKNLVFNQSIASLVLNTVLPMYCNYLHCLGRCWRSSAYLGYPFRLWYSYYASIV